MSEGWISLHRQIQNHWLWQEKPFDKRSAWFDLLMLANHQDNKFPLGNEWIEVERGSFITSELKLMDRWGWSKSKVRSFIKLLEQDQMLIKKSDKKKTTLTICNYNDYQDSLYHKKTTKEPQKDHKKTTKEPQKDTNNNDNNVNNENNMLLYSLSKDQERKTEEMEKPKFYMPGMETETFIKFYDWVDLKGYTAKAIPPHDRAYYLRYLHEQVNHYSKELGKDHAITKGHMRTFELFKERYGEAVIIEAKNIS